MAFLWSTFGSCHVERLQRDRGAVTRRFVVHVSQSPLLPARLFLPNHNIQPGPVSKLAFLSQISLP